MMKRSYYYLSGLALFFLVVGSVSALRFIDGIGVDGPIVTDIQGERPYLIENDTERSVLMSLNLTAIEDFFANLTAGITYNATSIETKEGTNEPGAVLNFILTVDDGLSYNITEDSTGADPMRFEVNFSSVDAFNLVVFRGWYIGGAGHEIYVQVYNFDTSSWDNHFEITDQSGFVTESFTVLDSSKHIDGSGNVWIQFNHSDGGRPGHSYRLDYLGLVSGTSLLTLSEHDALSGRESYSTNHPDYAQAIDANYAGKVNKSGDEIVNLIVNETLHVNDRITIGNNSCSDPLCINNSLSGPQRISAWARHPNAGAILQLRNNDSSDFSFGMIGSGFASLQPYGFYNGTASIFWSGEMSRDFNWVIGSDSLMRFWGDPTNGYSITTNDLRNTLNFSLSTGDIRSNGTICDSVGCIGGGGFDPTPQDQNITILYANASDQDARIIALEASNLEGSQNDTFLWANASNQDGRIDALEASGSAGFDTRWSVLGNTILSNSSNAEGNVNVTGNLYLDESGVYINASTLGAMNIYSINQPGQIKPFQEMSYDSINNVSRLRWYNTNAMNGVDGGDNGRLDYISRAYINSDLRGVFRIITPSKSASGSESIHLLGGNDGSDYLRSHTRSNQVTLEVVSSTPGAALYIKNASGDFASVLAHAFVVSSTYYEGNETQAISDLEEWINGTHPDNLASSINIVDDEQCQSTEEGLICTPIEYHSEKIGTDLAKAATAIVKYSKRNRKEGKRIRDRQEELISILYDKGYLNAEEALHLRDDF